MLDKFACYGGYLDYKFFLFQKLIFELFSTEFGGFGSVGGRIEIDIKINHEGEVNR